MSREAMAIAAFLVWSAPGIVRADILNQYVDIACKHKSSEAIISYKFNYNSDPAPPKSIKFEAVPHYESYKDEVAGLKLCSKGALSRVSIERMQDDHPRDDGLWIYLDNVRQIEQPISFNSNYTSYSNKIVFYKLPGKPFIMLECINGKTCRRSILRDSAEKAKQQRRSQ